MSESEYAVLFDRLTNESRAMNQDFDNLFDAFRQWLDNHNKSLECYKDILCNIRGFDKLECTVNSQFLEDRETEIYEADEIRKLHNIVKEYVNWLNNYLLGNIIESAAKKINVTQEDFISMVSEYNNKLESFCKRCIYECPFPPEKDKGDGSKKYLCIKVAMHERYVKLKINVLIEFHGRLIKALGLLPHTLKLCQADDGCIEILYSMPTSVHTALFPLHDDTLLKLESLAIIKICTPGYVKERNILQHFDQVQ